MKTKFSIALSTSATVVALTFASASKPVLAQEKGGRGQSPPPWPREGTRRAPVILGPPAGTQPLPIDLFISTNFYKDQAVWRISATSAPTRPGFYQ